MNGSDSIRLLSDGSIKMDGGVVFGQVPKGQWQEWIPPDRRNRVRLGLNCLLVRSGGRNYLIDSGSGQKLSPSMRDMYGVTTSNLLHALKDQGLTPQDIHGVVLTSLHFEHTGGCSKRDRRGELVPTFPKATYYVQSKALEEALSPNERQSGAYCLDDFMPLYEKGYLELLDGDAQLAPGLKVRMTGGPSAGHQIGIITHGGEWVVYLGDLVPTPHHLQLSCIAASDRAPEETLERKREVVEEASNGGWLLVFSHGVNERSGYLEHRNGRPQLRPVEIS
jgi:glyoxylase-like metal-dependent hydrolase (beta-lactamase superfamily II)